MIDEIYDRNYQDGRAALNRDIDAALSRIGRQTLDVFRSIHRITFDSPWLSKPSPRRHH